MYELYCYERRSVTWAPRISNKLTVIRQRNISSVGLWVLDRVPLSRDFFHVLSRLSRFHVTDPHRLSRNARIQVKNMHRSNLVRSRWLGVLINESRKSLISSLVADAFRPSEAGSNPFRILYRVPWLVVTSTDAPRHRLPVRRARQTYRIFNHNDVIDDKYVCDCWVLLPRLTLCILFLSKIYINKLQYKLHYKFVISNKYIYE